MSDSIPLSELSPAAATKSTPPLSINTVTSSSTSSIHHDNHTHTHTHTQPHTRGCYYIAVHATHGTEIHQAEPLLGTLCGNTVLTFVRHVISSRFWVIWTFVLSFFVFSNAVFAFNLGPIVLVCCNVPIILSMAMELARVDRVLFVRLWTNHFEPWFLLVNAIIHVFVGWYMSLESPTTSDFPTVIRERVIYLGYWIFLCVKLVTFNLDAMPVLPRGMRIIFTAFDAAYSGILMAQSTREWDGPVPLTFCIGEMCLTSTRLRFATLAPMCAFSLKYFLSTIFRKKRFLIIQADITRIVNRSAPDLEQDLQTWREDDTHHASQVRHRGSTVQFDTPLSAEMEPPSLSSSNLLATNQLHKRRSLLVSDRQLQSVVMTEPLFTPEVRPIVRLADIAFIRRLFASNIFLGVVVLGFACLLAEELFNIAGDRVWVLILFTSLLTVLVLSTLVLVDVPSARHVLSQFTFWFLVLNLIASVVTIILAQSQGTLGRDHDEHIRNVIFSYPFAVLSGIWVIAIDAFPLVPKHFRSLAIGLVALNQGRLLIRNVVSQVEDEAWEFCAPFCTDTRTIRISTHVNLLLFTSKLFFKSVLFPSRFVLSTAPVHGELFQVPTDARVGGASADSASAEAIGSG
jgi:hypothetical protein